MSAPKSAAVPGQFLLAQGLGAADEFAMHAAALAALAGAVLHRLHLHVVPVLPERRENAAVMRHVAVPVGRAFPHADRGEMRRLQRGDVPLVDAVIGDAVEADLAARPRLHAGPLDAVVEILGLARREVIDEPRRAAGAARVDAHADIIVRHPLLRIDDFPVLILVGRAGGDVGVLVDHALPRARVAVLEGEVLGVGPVGENDGELAVFHRTKDIGAQHEAVVHLDRHVPIDVHAVADFGTFVQRGHASPPGKFCFARGYRDAPV